MPDIATAPDVPVAILAYLSALTAWLPMALTAVILGKMMNVWKPVVKMR